MVDLVFGITGLIMGLAPWLLFYYNRKSSKKRLTYRKIHSEWILHKNSNHEKLKFFYEDKKIEDLALHVIEVINDGERYIAKDDFETSIKFSFNDDKPKILLLEILETTPKELEVAFTATEGMILFEPLLLNKNDKFRFKILTTNSHDANFIANARIKGISKLRKMSNTKYGDYSKRSYRLFNVFCFSGIVLLLANVFSKYFHDKVLLNLTTILLVTALPAIFCFVSMIVYIRKERKEANKYIN